MRYRKKWNSIFKDLQFENNLPVKLSFSIRITHNNTFYKYQQNWSFNIFFIWQNLRSKTLFRANFKKKFKEPLFHCREISDRKYWWCGEILSVLSKSILNPGSLFIKFLKKVIWKLGKLKSQNFKSCMFDGPVIVNIAFS